MSIRAVRQGLVVSCSVLLLAAFSVQAAEPKKSVVTTPSDTPSDGGGSSNTTDAVQKGSSKRGTGPILISTKVKPFQMQIGIGGTLLIPGQALWDTSTGFGFYQTGLQFNLLGRVHPYVTLELGVGGTGNPYGTYFIGTYGEFATNFGARFYVRSMDKGFTDEFFVAPYVVGTLLLNGAGSNALGTGATLYVGTQVGGGVEFRLNSHMVINTDLRLILRGSVNTSPMLPQVGLQLGGGFGYYF